MVVTGIAVGPEQQCEIDNHDRYVVEAHRAGVVMLAGAVALIAAASFLAAGAFGDRSKRSTLRHALASVGSFAVAGFVTLIGLFELSTFACLE